jgi:hypothetical protein
MKLHLQRNSQRSFRTAAATKVMLFESTAAMCAAQTVIILAKISFADSRIILKKSVNDMAILELLENGIKFKLNGLHS